MQYKCQRTIITIDDLMKLKIDLDAKYQRDCVWTDDDKRLFIDSVYRNLDTGYVIFNKKNNIYINIDGKQRISSLISFLKNNLYIMIDEYIVFYDLVHEQYVNSEIARVMTLKEQHRFMNRKIYLTIYEDIKYEDEIEIFKRLQDGVKLSSGEKLASCFNDEEVRDYFHQWCENKKDIFSTMKNIDIKRKTQHNFIAELLYLIDYGITTIDKKASMKYVKEIKTISELQDKICAIEPAIDLLFGKHMFKHDKTDKEVFQVVLLGLSYYIASSLDFKDHIHVIDYTYTRQCLNKIIGKTRSVKSHKTKDNFEIVINKCVKYMPKIRLIHTHVPIKDKDEDLIVF